VTVDNRGYLAVQTYHRHQVPGPDYPVWDQFRRPDGTPIYPQRALLLGPLFAEAASGTVQSGRFAGKMIVVCCLTDREAFPWQADWYRARVQAHLGKATDDSFRLWYVDNALHGDREIQEDPTHTVSYLGVLHQALRDLSAWAERGIDPPPSSNYEVVDGQVVVPSAASARGGVQPTVVVTVDGADSTAIDQGQSVTLRVMCEVPPDTGVIVAVDWDLDGTGSFATHEEFDPAPAVTVERQWSPNARGTWFPVVRVASERHGDKASRFARIQNIARARVVVH
jgi:hypothetical protein